MASPATMSRMMSKGASCDSSRRPITRVIAKTKKYRKIARRTRSMATSREDEEIALDGRDPGLAVHEVDPLLTLADGGWVYLELEEDVEAFSRVDRAVFEPQGAVLARLLGRRRLERVHRHSLQPIGMEDERGILELSSRLDREVRLEEKASPHALRSAERERGRRARCLRVGRPLAEEIEEAEHRHDGDRCENPASHPDLMTSALQVAVSPQGDSCRRVCHVRPTRAPAQGLRLAELGVALQPEAEAFQISLVEDRDHDVVELLCETHLPVLSPRRALPHDRALDVGADFGEVEVGSQGLTYVPVLVSKQDELVRLVLPDDAVLVQNPGERFLNRMGEGRDLLRWHLA